MTDLSPLVEVYALRKDINRLYQHGYSQIPDKPMLPGQFCIIDQDVAPGWGEYMYTLLVFQLPVCPPIHPSNIVRNTGFIICSICGLIALNWNQHIPDLFEWSLIGFSAIAFIFIWTQLGIVFRLFS